MRSKSAFSCVLILLLIIDRILFSFPLFFFHTCHFRFRITTLNGLSSFTCQASRSRLGWTACNLALRLCLPYRDYADEVGLIFSFFVLNTSCRCFLLLSCRRDTAGLQRRAAYTDKYKLQEWHRRWNSSMCEEQMKGEYREEEEGHGDETTASMMHCFALSPMVQLFVICQSPGTVELKESKQC